MLRPETAFLAVIDVQGKLAEIVHDAEDTSWNIVRLVMGAKLLGVPIIATEQAPEKLGETVEDVRNALAGVPRLKKVTFSCCADETIDAAFRHTGRKQAILCGIEAHVCVYQSAMELLDKGYEVHVVTDATSSRAISNKETACARMSAEGAKLSTTEMCLFELKVDCLGDEFRKLSTLLK